LIFYVWTAEKWLRIVNDGQEALHLYSDDLCCTLDTGVIFPSGESFFFFSLLPQQLLNGPNVIIRLPCSPSIKQFHDKIIAKLLLNPAPAEPLIVSFPVIFQ
jgi:hypothetical protein